MHRFIVYQYGKVASTSLVKGLNKLPQTEAFQSHFLGKKAFSEILDRLQDPSLSDYFFKHSSGQLMENLAIYRHYLRRETSEDKLTMISMAREPFDWFRSCITQDMEQNLAALKTQLDKQNLNFSSDAEAVERGMNLVFSRISYAIQHLGSVDQVATKKRFLLREHWNIADQVEFKAFMHFLHMFLRPHTWFQTHFREALETDIRDLTPMDHGVFSFRQDWGNIYLMRYEDLTEGFPVLLKDLGFTQNIPLSRKNVSGEKLHYVEMKAAFSTPEARELKALCQSEDTRFMGY